MPEKFMTFEIITLGCKLNNCESAAIAAGLEKIGLRRAEKGDIADLSVINSCAVTGTAVAKTRHAVSKCRRENPYGIVVLCGCFPQSYPKEAGLRLGADIVAGNSHKGKLPIIISEYLDNRIKTVKVSPLTREYDESAAIPDNDRTRAFIKIEDGCDNFCTYCIIPTARGRARSLRPERITEQSLRCVNANHQEIVLTGINLGCYGAELGLSLADAVKACAESGIGRIRLSSLEPECLTDEEIMKLKSVPQLCPHFHLSLQSGSDSVLKRMSRRYDTEQFTHIADKLRAEFPGCSITTDVIAGFPEETDEEFAESVEFIKKIGFAKIHVFPYSIREGTVAAEMRQVPPAVRKLRVKALVELADSLEAKFFEQQIGTVHEVLIERPQSEAYSSGFTENYLPVRFYEKAFPRNSLITVKITGFRGGYCTGTVKKFRLLSSLET